jgi:hypothetical protein
MPQTRPAPRRRTDDRDRTPDRELTHPLERLKSAIRVFVTCDLVLFVGLFLTLWFWVGVGADYGLFKAFGVDVAQQLTPALRIGATLVLGVTLVALVVWRGSVLLNKRFSLTALALVLEKRHRQLLGDRLITALQMYDVAKAERAGFSGDLVRHTIREARDRMRQVRVLSVFNWGRLWLKGVLILLVWVLGMGTALGVHALATGEVNLTRSLKKTADVCGTFTERNLLFIPTPWPRRAHVEVVEFDDDGHPNELRVGKGYTTPPKVTARALRWVVADDPRANPDGWRPLTVGDLAAFGVAPPAGYAGPESADLRVDDLERANGWAESHPTVQALTAAADDPANSRTLRVLEVPSALKMRVDGMQTRSRNAMDMAPDATGKFAVEVPNLTESVRFTITAEDFTTARRFITLVPPPAIIDLSRDEFQPAYMHFPTPILSDQEKAELSDLYGTTAIRPELLALRGRAIKLGGRKISMAGDKATFSVPVGTEVHLTAETDKDLKAIEVRAVGPNPLAAPEFLKAEAKVEERDAKGVIVSEGFTDLPIGRPAGASEAKLEVKREPATGLQVGGPVRRFTLKFEGKRAVRQLDKPTEFQVVMTDTDNVQSTRTVAIAATDDAPPQVEVLVDPVIRKVGGAYMVTPIARVPFLTDSKVWDNEGLSSLRFEFKKTAKEAQSLVNLRAMAAAAMTANALAPTASWGTPTTAVYSQTQFDLSYGSTIPLKDSSGNVRYPGVDVDRFTNDSGTLQRLTLAQLNEVTVPRDDTPLADQWVAAELAKESRKISDMPPADLAKRRAEMVARLRAGPPPTLRADRGLPTVKAVKLTDQNGDAFDLRRFMPELPMKATEAVQQKYDIELYVTARDVNIDLTGKDGKPAEPKTARNLDPIRLLVVSDQDLLVEIGKDEEMQGTRMDDALAKATGGKGKLDREFGLIRGIAALTPKEKADQLLSSQVRLTDISQDLAKTRELLTAMRTEYDKLYREMDVNRLPAVNMEKYRNKPDVVDQLKNGYLDLLAMLLDDGRAVSKAEKSVEAVRGTLGGQQVPTPDALSQADGDYQAVLNLLTRLQIAVGAGNDINKQRALLKQITEEQEKILALTRDWLKEANTITSRPDVVLPKDVTKIAVGKKAKVKLGVRWKLYPESTLFIGFEVPKATELVFAPEDGVAVKSKGDEEVTYVEVEVSAGSKPGVHTVTLRPGTFRPIELQIEVTK